MTGYPADLLDPDLDLEADLGVDTVKQAEVFAAVRAQWDLVRDDNLQLREFPTLNHVAAWVRSRLGVAAPAAATAPATAPVAPAPAPAAPASGTASPAVAGDPILDTVTGIVAEMTGYPADLLDPDLDLEADLGVDTVKQAEVFAAVRARWDLERDDTLQLREFPTLNHVAGWVRGKLGQTAPGHGTSQRPQRHPSPRLRHRQPPVHRERPPQATSSSTTVTGIVAEMTGYPADLLDPDLDLEADLGVDTVKQAEVFAAVRARWDLERDDTLQLREFPTLNSVAGWVRGKLGDAAPDRPEPPTSPGAPRALPPLAPRHPTPCSVTSTRSTRSPGASPRPRCDPLPTSACRPESSLSGARVVVMRDEGGVGDALVQAAAQGRSHRRSCSTPAHPPTSVLAQLARWTADGPVTGVYWLAALDDEGDLATYDLATWREALRRRVKVLYAVMRHLWADDAFLVSATRLGGHHGYSTGGATSVLGGAVTGFTKSYKKERPGALVKAVDLPVDRRTAAVADLLVEETLRDPGCVEVGRVDGHRFGIALLEQPFPARGPDDDTAATTAGCR